MELPKQDEIPDLPYTPVTQLLSDDECPPVSILIPCYLRRKFKPLILCNIIYMDYPKDKLELCILQDGPEDLFESSEERKWFEEQIGPTRLKYVYEPKVRRSIGEKRNRLVKIATHKICAMIDSDDIYIPSYIRYSVSAMKEHKAGITSSASMIFMYPEKNYKLSAIRCGHKHQGHEATMVFTKKHFNSMGGFIGRGSQGNQGEGTKMITYNEKNMINLSIDRLMVCVCHSGDDGNTINKDRFLSAEFQSELADTPHLRCVKRIFSQSESQTSLS
jgi:hypothetical protein